ncbi:DUF916 and DUF3324 domain-containing protein [Bhargavaea ginsengi]|uniref:DUF916 and DUF3324 domain-containing protein n=1 Tax=Bhargavaea ginsengi TaxID=426757 RepID=UPI00203B2606|nr:DUF916 and DUF3324 domain-containing protein [Bhargavaea ginsengi]MCM3087527.1 DUF916 and DUF3324 domain-containing protein [Bhargavaea ginsengi]
MFKRISGILLLLILYVTMSPIMVVSADEPVGYSVKAELPDNQVNQNVSYFDLRVEPNQEQELKVTIYNHEDQEITVRTAVRNASTNSNGLIVYEEQDELDPSLEQPITELVSLEKDEISVPASGSETLTATLKVPGSPFDGVKLGGLHFEKVPEELSNGEGVQIQNKYAYIIGLQISGNDEEVAPELNLTSIEPGLVNHRTAVVTNIQNSQPVIVDNLSIEAKVYVEGDSAAIKEKNQENMNMAPNSAMDYVIDWDNEPLQAGNYLLEMTASDGDHEWQWQENFSISESDEDLNESAVELEDEDTNTVWYIVGIIVLLIIILSLVVYIQKLKRGNNE